MIDWARARANMVAGQIHTNDVTDRRILDAFAEVPRESFVPAARVSLACSDVAIPLPSSEDGPGRAMLTPLTLARLVALAEVRPDDVALDVGCGTGYSAAILARLAGSVVALEENETLAARAADTLNRLGVDNAAVVTGPLAEGYSAEAPYDVILLNGGVEEVPQVVLDQLGTGGRLVCVLGIGPVGRATVFVRDEGHFGRRSAYDAAAAPLPGFLRRESFTF